MQNTTNDEGNVPPGIFLNEAGRRLLLADMGKTDWEVRSGSVFNEKGEPVSDAKIFAAYADYHANKGFLLGANAHVPIDFRSQLKHLPLY